MREIRINFYLMKLLIKKLWKIHITILIISAIVHINMQQNYILYCITFKTNKILLM